MSDKLPAPNINPKLRRHILGFPFISLIVLIALSAIGWNWLQDHPEHNPYAPLDLRQPASWATDQKMRELKADTLTCRRVLERSEVAYAVLPASGEGPCARTDRTQLSGYPLAPNTPAVTCPVAAALELWRIKTLNPTAQQIFGSDIASIEHLGAFSCRRMYGDDQAPWSEHSTANAIDIAGFTLKNGTRIKVLGDWNGEAERAQFLREVRDGACGPFATVLSPDYNAAHADHFHLDQDDRWISVCR